MSKVITSRSRSIVRCQNGRVRTNSLISGIGTAVLAGLAIERRRRELQAVAPSCDTGACGCRRRSPMRWSLQSPGGSGPGRNTMRRRFPVPGCGPTPALHHRSICCGSTRRSPPSRVGQRPRPVRCCGSTVAVCWSVHRTAPHRSLPNLPPISAYRSSAIVTGSHPNTPIPRPSTTVSPHCSGCTSRPTNSGSTGNGS